MSKKLTLTAIKDSNKKFSQKQRVDLPDGNHAFIFPHFSPTKLMDLIKELLLEYVDQDKNGIKKSGIDFNTWTALSLLYKFADLGIPSDVKKKIVAFSELIEYDHTGDIMSSFPKESIDKLKTTMENIQKNMDLLIAEGKISAESAIDQAVKMETENEVTE